MAVNTQFVVCIPGQWTSICEYRETRKSLMVQLLDGVAILAVNTSGPLQVTSYGTVPSGFFHSALTGTGPAVWDLSYEWDHELTWQEWFAWVLPVGGTQTPTVWAPAPTGGPPPIGDIALPVTAFLWVMWTQAATTGVAPLTATSANLGVLVPFNTSTVVDGMGDQQQVDLYILAAPIGDTISFSAIGPGNYEAGIAGGVGVAVDSVGTNTDSGTSITATTAAAAQAVGELVVVVIQGEGLVTVSSVSGDIANPQLYSSQFFSPDGSAWTVISVIGSVTQAATPTSVTVALNSSIGPASTAIATLTLAAPILSPKTITVTESFGVAAFDDPHWVDPARKITVRMPQLSPEGVAALRDLLIKMKPLEETAGEQ